MTPDPSSSRPSLPAYKVGDSVEVLVSGRRRHSLTAGTIEKVGRVWLTVRVLSRSHQFDPSSGRERSGAYLITTPEIRAFEERLQTARQRVTEASGRGRLSPPDDLSIDQLDRIADILLEPRQGKR